MYMYSIEKIWARAYNVFSDLGDMQIVYGDTSLNYSVHYTIPSPLHTHILTIEATYVRSNQWDSKHLEAQYARYTEVHVLSCGSIIPCPVSGMHSRPRECRPRDDEGAHVLSDIFQSSSGGYGFCEACKIRERERVREKKGKLIFF